MFRSISRCAIVAAAACTLAALPSACIRAQSGPAQPRVAVVFETSETATPALLEKAAAPFAIRLDIKVIGVSAGSTQLPAGTDLASYDLVVDALSSTQKALSPVVEAAESHTHVLIVDAPGAAGNVELSHADWPAQYWANLSMENIANLLRLAESDVLHVSDTPAAEPVRYPNQAFYHPGAPHYFASLPEYIAWYSASGPGTHAYVSSRCTVGVLFYFTYYMQQNLAPFDAVMNEIENRGCNVVSLMTKGAPQLGALRLPNGQPFADVLLYNGERINLRNYEAGTNEANALGVPLLGLYLDYKQSREQYLSSAGGLAPGTSGTLTDAEQDGVFEPLMIGSRNNPHDPRALRGEKVLCDLVAEMQQNNVEVHMCDTEDLRVDMLEDFSIYDERHVIYIDRTGGGPWVSGYTADPIARRSDSWDRVNKYRILFDIIKKKARLQGNRPA